MARGCFRFPMPWPALAKLKPFEVDAIVAYLRTIPAIHNEIPKPRPLSFFPYLWAKFKMLVLKEDFNGETYFRKCRYIERGTTMKRILKWIGAVLGILLVVGFVLFLYFIPPFTSMPPEDFINPEPSAWPDSETISDPRERMLAERGRYIVLTHDCSGCHTTGDNGPDFSRYLAGGSKSTSRESARRCARI